MRMRCNNKNMKCYKDYGGRGISICNEWNDFMNFRHWANSSGYDESAERGICTLERKNCNGNYEPGNCVWATTKEQNNNKQHHYLVTFDGKTKNLAQWAKQYGINRETLRSRLECGWDIEKALITPTRIIH